MKITRVVYSSKKASNLGAKDIEQILEIARRNNAKLGITGILILAEGCFLQLLEGDERVIDGLLAKIKADKGHSEMEVLAKENSSRRLLSEWAMAYSLIDDQGMKQIGGTFDMRVAREFLEYLKRGESYLKPIFKDILSKIN